MVQGLVHMGGAHPTSTVLHSSVQFSTVLYYFVPYLHCSPPLLYPHTVISHHPYIFITFVINVIRRLPPWLPEIYTKKHKLQIEALDNAILETAKNGRFSLREFQFTTPSTSLLGPQDFKLLADEYANAGYDVSLGGYNNNVFTISWQK